LACEAVGLGSADELNRLIIGWNQSAFTDRSRFVVSLCRPVSFVIGFCALWIPVIRQPTSTEKKPFFSFTLNQKIIPVILFSRGKIQGKKKTAD
jgi:hypothetical protein